MHDNSLFGIDVSIPADDSDAPRLLHQKTPGKVPEKSVHKEKAVSVPHADLPLSHYIREDNIDFDSSEAVPQKER